MQTKCGCCYHFIELQTYLLNQKMVLQELTSMESGTRRLLCLAESTFSVRRASTSVHW